MKLLPFILAVGLTSCAALKPQSPLIGPAAALAVSVVLDGSSDSDRAAKIAEIQKVIDVVESFPVDNLVTKDELKEGLVYALPKKPHWELFAQSLSDAYGDAVAGYVNNAEGARQAAEILKQIADNLKIVIK